MPFKQRMYSYDVAILKDYGGIKRKISIHKCLRNKGLEVEKKQTVERCTVNDEKLDCNVSRTKSNIFELAYCNNWEYFITLTVDQKKYDRTDLKKYKKDLMHWLRNYNQKHKLHIKYLLIPELHKDGKSWHMHGFIMGLPFEHLTLNKNGYLDWYPYQKKFGYISMDKIKDRQKVASYITKYITKDLSDCVNELNANMYYCSQGLKRADIIKKGSMFADIDTPDFNNEWVTVKWYNTDTPIEVLKKLIT